MSVYESLKQFIYPQITIWESHLVTIIFSSTLATVAAYFVQKVYMNLQVQTINEMKERKDAQLKLSQAYDDLELKIEGRTKELSNSNQRLKEEIRIRKATEKKLRRSEERFSKVFHNAPLSIVIVDFEEGRFQMVNNCFLRLMECDNRDQIQGKTIFDLEMYADDEEWRYMISHLGEHGPTPFSVDTRIRTLLGEIRFVILTAEKITVNGKVSILMMLHDITARRKQKESKQRFENHHY